ncbi:hypothetical protein LTR37_013724 [Vermiconidia calcicola]|uniref:Uncharacterized protein n=1 Tax=Vermiconidia calcicola TaxID=1690605 RepID=A0ACC3MVI7_9PEZI|nr:hypothetical protein LTR37_013724 [Vermiconidia calcicola]
MRTGTVTALFFSALEFSDYQIGIFMTLTLLGDVFLGGFLTLIADRSGRRRVLIGGSLLMVMSGVVFATVSNFWILLVAAVFGVVSVTGGDFGPFRSIEESMLSHLTTPQTRADVLSWYVFASTIASSIGSEFAGQIIHILHERRKWTLADAYHILFWTYSAMGLINAGLTMLLTDDCEITKDEKAYSQLPQEEEEEYPEHTAAPAQNKPAMHDQSRKPWYRRFWTGLSSRLSQISGPTRKIMYKLWLLLALDSVADGMVPYALTNYYIDEKFSPSKAALGSITSAAYLLAAISAVFAGPMARKIGLINTMVFTHIPSSAAVLVFPLPSNFILTVMLLFVRAGLNNMDQAPRSAFIAGVVKPEERTAAMGITAIIRTLAAMAGPTFTGILAGNDSFWIAFVAAGACRLAYDVGLYVLFINVKLHQHEGGAAAAQHSLSSPRLSDEEMTELDDLSHDSGKDTPPSMPETLESPSRASEDHRLAPQPRPDVRRRSPSPLAKSLRPQ